MIEIKADIDNVRRNFNAKKFRFHASNITGYDKIVFFLSLDRTRWVIETGIEFGKQFGC